MQKQSFSSLTFLSKCISMEPSAHQIPASAFSVLLPVVVCRVYVSSIAAECTARVLGIRLHRVRWAQALLVDLIESEKGKCASEKLTEHFHKK